MILIRYCIDCGAVRPDETSKCCPDARVYWIEKEAAEELNKMMRNRHRTFQGLLDEIAELRRGRHEP